MSLQRDMSKIYRRRQRVNEKYSSFLNDNDEDGSLLMNTKYSMISNERKVENPRILPSVESSSLRDIETAVMLNYQRYKDLTKHMTCSSQVMITLEDINNSYVQLYMQMLKEMMRMMNSKLAEKDNEIKLFRENVPSIPSTSNCDDNHEELLYAQEQLTMANNEIFALTRSLNSKDKQIHDLSTTMKSQQMKLLENETLVQQLTRDNVAYEREVNELQNLRNLTADQIYKLSQTIQKKFELVYGTTPDHIRSELDDTLRTFSREIISRSGRMVNDEHSKALKDLRKASTLAYKFPKKTASTQTEVDDYGVWDRQDGWIVPISENILARNRWRRAFNYAKCPNCRGSPKYIESFIKSARAQIKDLRQRNLLPMFSKTDAVRRCLWPDSFLQFLTHIPKTFQGRKAKSLSWCLCEISRLLSQKYVSDVIDKHQAVWTSTKFHLLPIQSMEDFLIEYYLVRCHSKQEAEIMLFETLIAIDEHCTRHPLIFMMAKLLGIYRAKNLLRKTDKVLVASSSTKKKTKKLSSADDKIVLSSKSPDKRKQSSIDTNGEMKDEASDQISSTLNAAVWLTEMSSQSFLPLEIVSIYLLTRQCFLAEYSGTFMNSIHKAKESATDSISSAETSLLRETEKKFLREADFLDVVAIPKHVCIHNSLSKTVTKTSSGVYSYFIPLDRVVRVLYRVLSFCDYQEFVDALETIEDDAIRVLEHGILVRSESVHTYIRSMTRLFMQCASPDGRDLTWQETLAIKGAAAAEASNSLRIDPTSTETEEISIDDVIQYLQGQLDGESTASHSYYQEPKVFMVDMDICLTMVVKVLTKRLHMIENQLREIFVEGDLNGDGVLTFEEFKEIVRRVNPSERFHQAKILKMFREALLEDSEDDIIGPDSFVKVCRKYDLICLVDLDDLKWNRLRALLNDKEILIQSGHVFVYDEERYYDQEFIPNASFIPSYDPVSHMEYQRKSNAIGFNHSKSNRLKNRKHSSMNLAPHLSVGGALNRNGSVAVTLAAPTTVATGVQTDSLSEPLTASEHNRDAVEVSEEKKSQGCQTIGLICEQPLDRMNDCDPKNLSTSIEYTTKDDVDVDYLFVEREAIDSSRSHEEIIVREVETEREQSSVDRSNHSSTDPIQSGIADSNTVEMKAMIDQKDSSIERVKTYATISTQTEAHMFNMRRLPKVNAEFGTSDRRSLLKSNSIIKGSSMDSAKPIYSSSSMELRPMKINRVIHEVAEGAPSGLWSDIESETSCTNKLQINSKLSKEMAKLINSQLLRLKGGRS